MILRDNLPRHRIEIQAQSLSKSSGLSIGIFMPSEDIQSQNQWATLLDSDIVVVPAMVFRRSLLVTNEKTDCFEHIEPS